MDPLLADRTLINNIPAVPVILDVVCRTTGMGFAAVARVTEEKWVACSVLDKIEFGLKPGGELKLETTICNEIRQSHKAVIIDHVDEDAHFCRHHTPAMYGFQSYISMPIILPDGRFFGTLCCIDPRPARVSSPEIVSMFKLFAELIAFHIDALEKLSHSQSVLVAERGVSELREQFIGVLGHDLRTPLGAISTSLDLIRESPLDEDQTMAVGVMDRSVTRMSGLIEDTLDFTRGRLGGGITLDSSTTAPLEPILQDVIAESRAFWPDRQVAADFDLQEPVRYDRKRLSQLFTNLLSNALTYGNADQPVRVAAHSRGGVFELSVSNGADPIPPAVLERLFEPFSRGGSGNYGKGLGLGLYIASQIAKSHGGGLKVHSDVEETCFTFSMPTLAGQ